MVLDQHANPTHAVKTRFFDKPAWTGRGLALISARRRVPVVPAFAHRQRTGEHVLRYMPPVHFARGSGTVREALIAHTSHYTALIEAEVMAHPAQWTWLHRRWKS